METCCLACAAGALGALAGATAHRYEQNAPLVFQGCQVRRLVSHEGLQYKLCLECQAMNISMNISMKCIFLGEVEAHIPSA